MKIIDLEAHFYTEEYLNYLRSRKDVPWEERQETAFCIWHAPNMPSPRGSALNDRLIDLGAGRLKEMDTAGVDIQVLSLSSPGCEQFEASEGTALAKQTNDELWG